MNAREAGFLLLSSRLGNPSRKVLSTYQLRMLFDRMRTMERPREARELTKSDLLALGIGNDLARQILELLEDEALLDRYCARAKRSGCMPLTRVSTGYPAVLRQRLGLDSPGCLWAKGNLELLRTPGIALVGSRELKAENREFAAAVGHLAAGNGWTLISGNARGADRTAQDACLSRGGSVISVVADELEKHVAGENRLYLSEEGFDEPFSAQRALSRNRCIHALGQITFVAQSDLHKGGTWDGTVKNLRFGWSPVACFRDGSEASRMLEQMGAYLIGMEELADFSGFGDREQTLFEMEQL